MDFGDLHPSDMRDTAAPSKIFHGDRHNHRYKTSPGSGWSKRYHDFRIGAIPNTQDTVMATGDYDFAIGA